jgi:polyisoprenyl-teichoic acid--peptidoglycan teichoic acid transferase
MIALNLLIPGSVQLLAGSRRFARVGIVATMTFWVLLIALIAVALVHKSWLISIVSMPVVDAVLAVVLFAYAILYAVLSLDTLRLMKLGRLYNRERRITLVAMLLAGVLGTSAIAYAGNLAGVSASTLGAIFNQSGLTQPVDGRYNIMLLGSDSGADRFGIRPDSISVISINATTGQAVNIGIPRNLQHVSFVPGSPMLKVYPNGWDCGEVCLINAIYKDTTDNHSNLYPDAVKHGSTPGVEATRDAVEYVTGLKIQSYVMVDMAAFASLVDALGGVDINVKERLPIGGQKLDLSDVTGWIEIGQQHMNGYHAMWYARSRHSTTDYDRMARQREVEQAILSQFDPANVLTRFQSIAAAGTKLVKTDIPSGMLAQYVELATKLKSEKMASLELVPANGVNVIHPDFNSLHAMVQAAIAAETKK